MASTHIEISGTASRLSADVRQAIDNLRREQETMQKVKDIMDQVAMGQDWAALATKLGVTAAEAEAVYNLWGSANIEVRATFLTQLVSRVG